MYVSGGEGSTSEGEFFEALNTACLKSLPLLILIEDNGYAISVPVEFETAGGSISRLVANYPGLHIEECDGTDPLASYAVLKSAAEYCRARKGPALVHAHVTRPYSHSLSDDEKLYKTARKIEEDAHRDPIPKFGLFLVREGIIEEKELEELEAAVDLRSPGSDGQGPSGRATREGMHTLNVYSPDVDPDFGAIRSGPAFFGRAPNHGGNACPPRWPTKWRATNGSSCSART